MTQFTIKVIKRGDKYGLNNCLTHDKLEPLVEFYDGTQFVSRYYLDTILTHGARPLSLQGDVPAWTVSGEQMQQFVNELSEV